MASGSYFSMLSSYPFWEAQDFQTFTQLFVLCKVFLFTAFSFKLCIKILSLSPELPAILFCWAFATFLSINLISTFCTQFQPFALNFNFLHCLGLIDMLSVNQHDQPIFACISLYQKYYAGKYIVISDLPNKLDIGTANVKVVHATRCQGYLSCNDAPSKQQFKSVILDNKENSTSFLM